jgi:hypothetical protein
MPRRLPDLYKGFPVPYIARWEAETLPDPVVRLDDRGIGIAGHKRDKNGVLWRPALSRPGQGRPLHGQVHGPRQRKAMRRLLCQVCGGRPDHNKQGWLWLLRDARPSHEDWPEEEITTHPPVCRLCGALSALLCKHLWNGTAVALRVRRPIVDGVWGLPYAVSKPWMTPRKPDAMLHGDPAMPWMLGHQIAASLTEVTIVDLPTLRPEDLTAEVTDFLRRAKAVDTDQLLTAAP